MREDLVYGIHVIRHLLAANPEKILEIYTLGSRDDQAITNIIAQAKQFGIASTSMSKNQVETLFKGVNHQGIAARIRLSSLLSLEDFLPSLEKNSSPPLLLILDSIQDPHNLGAILRTADAAGVTAVIIPKDRSVGLTPAVRKVASGAAETVPLIQVTNLVRAIGQLREHNLWIVGTAAHAKPSLYQVDLRIPVALALGAEGSGLRRLTEENCDILMHIPMQGVIESLNVSVAAGICLYEALRQRELRT